VAETSPGGTDREEIDALAGEYVLGTLDANERAAAETRMRGDRTFAAAVAAWERRLQPLADMERPVQPAEGGFDRILAAIGLSSSPAANDNLAALRRSLWRWRAATLAAAAAALVLAVFAAVDRPAPQRTEYVATLTPDGGAPAFILTVNTASNTLSIRRIGDDAPSDKSYELWAVHEGQPAKSMGVVEQASYSLDMPYEGDSMVFAISLEPKGGSPTGVATGPVVFSGPLLPMD